MKARIYKPAKTAMQSGRGRTTQWRLEFEREKAEFIDPLMGWVGSAETTQQVRIDFATQQEAIDYAKSINLQFEVIEPKTMHRAPKAYADNFRFDRIKA